METVPVIGDGRHCAKSNHVRPANDRCDAYIMPRPFSWWLPRGDLVRVARIKHELHAVRPIQLSNSRTQQSALSRRDAPELFKNFCPRKHRGPQGKPGARRTHSLVCEIKQHTSKYTTGLPETPGLPCAMVLTVSFVLSPVTGLDCHRRPADDFRKA